MALHESDQEPTGECIRETFDSVEQYWSTQFTKDTALDALYNSEHTIDVVDTEEEGRRRQIQPERMESREAARVVDLVRSLYTGPTELTTIWTGDRPRSPEKAEKAALALNEIINQLNPPTDSPLRRERYWMILMGRAARLIVPGDAYYWDFPTHQAGQTIDEWWETYNEWKRQAPIPLVWKDLLPTQTFPPTMGRTDDEVVSWLDLTRDELEEMFSPRELNDLEDIHPVEDDAYRLVIFSNRQWLGYSVLNNENTKGDLLLRTYKHGMGVPAIRILPGITSGRKQPGHYWLSILEHVLEMIPQIDRRLSEAATGSLFSKLPMFKMWLNGGSTASDLEQFFEGDMIPLQQQQGPEQPREDIEPLFTPQFGAETQALAQFGLSRVERITGAVEALEGAFGPSGQPAWARNFSHDVAAAKFSDLTDAIVASDLDAAEMIMRAVVAFGEDVRITGHPQHQHKGVPRITLTVADAEHYRPLVKGRYRLKVPLNERADLNLMVDLLGRIKTDRLPISPPFIMSRLGQIDDPFRMYEDSLLWQFLQSDRVMEFQQQRLVEELGIGLAQSEGMGLEEFMKEAADWPPEVRAALLQEVLGPAAGVAPAGNGGPGGGRGVGMSGGLAPDAQGAMRAGIPFSAAPGGPHPAPLVIPET